MPSYCKPHSMQMLPLPATHEKIGLGQSLVAQIVNSAKSNSIGIKTTVFPSIQESDALSDLLWRLPREIRSLIYGHLLDGFKSYNRTPVTRKETLENTDDTYVFDHGSWYSLSAQHGAKHPITRDTILEYYAVPWTQSNLAHLFTRTPAKHIRALDPELFEECVDDLCLSAGAVRISLFYDGCRQRFRCDSELLRLFVQRARHLIVDVSCSTPTTKSICGELRGKKTPMAEREYLAVVDDLYDLLDEGCSAQSLTLNLHFDKSISIEAVREQVHTLTTFGSDIRLNISQVVPARNASPPDPCSVWIPPAWEPASAHWSDFVPREGWSSWQERGMTVYEAAALSSR